MIHSRSIVCSGRSLLAMIVFLAVSALILVIVCDRYLLPAMQTAQASDPAARKQLAAISLLVMIIVLVVLLGVLLLIIRPGRLFLPRKGSPQTRTRYIDAWSESARRLQTPPEDE